MRCWSIVGGIALLAASLGCHREVEMIPLAERTIYTTDRFYDVQALTTDRAFVVGYGGKIMETTDGGLTWKVHESGVDNALYAVRFADDKHGWITGQDALILRTEDGGKTWQKQESNAVHLEKEGTRVPLYLFGLWVQDKDHAWAVGDRSILTSTTDGGKTWRARKVAQELDVTGGESLAAADPIWYDITFPDPQHGWIVGEFGKIMHTPDGGETWHEQEKTLMSKDGVQVYMDLLDLPTLYGIHMKTVQEGVAGGLEGHIARTRDGGATWAFDPLEVDYPIADPIFRAIELSDGEGWAVGAAGEVVRKAPGAPAWKRANLGQDVLTWLRGISFSDPKHGWMVGGYGLIYRTTDGGETWLPSQG